MLQILKPEQNSELLTRKLPDIEYSIAFVYVLDTRLNQSKLSEDRKNFCRVDSFSAPHSPERLARTWRNVKPRSGTSIPLKIFLPLPPRNDATASVTC